MRRSLPLGALVALAIRTLRAAVRAPFLLAALVTGVVALAAGALFLIPTPYQVLLPGPVTDVQRVIQPYPKPIKGALYLTTIYSEPASAGEWLYAKVNPDAGIVPREEARPKDMSEREYEHVLTQMMDESKVAAKVVALRAAGYDVKITGQGAQVQDVQDTSKARDILKAKDVIVAVDGQPVSTSNDLIALIQSHRPGEVVEMTVKRDDQTLTLSVPLGESPDEPGRARVGIAILTHLYQYELPKEVDLETKNIGGNSAGLMFALGIYNAVSPVDITGGRKIAGTGTISTDGKVGAIGGAKYKVRAAEKAHAEVFLVPPDNYDEARQAARHIRVVKVATFQEALDALAALPQGP
jgi:PDZ domain-containing protein